MLGAAIVAFIMSLFPKGFWTKVFLGTLGVLILFAYMSPAAPVTKRVHVESTDIRFHAASPDHQGYQRFQVRNESKFVLRDLVADCENADGTIYKLNLRMEVLPHSMSMSEVQSVSAFQGAKCVLSNWNGYKAS